MKAILTQLHYCVPLTDKQWKRLNRINARGDDRTDIDPALEKSGANNIEFNGHFGRNIFFSIDKEKHLIRVLKTIERLVAK